MGTPRRFIVFALAAAVLAPVAEARPVTLDGVTFSDERGGFSIIEASGKGSREDPFIVVEEITAATAAVLVVRGLGPGFGNRTGTLHPLGFVLRKIVTNRTSFVWNFVDFELQQSLGVSSDTFDGLSFGQGASSGKPFTSDRFLVASEISEPLDYISFHDGDLRPGETATFDVIVTETSPAPIFYLIQRPNRPISFLTGDAAAW